MNIHIRELCREIYLNHNIFIQPIFIEEGLDIPKETMPNVFIETRKSIFSAIEKDIASGIRKFLLFPIVKEKTVSLENRQAVYPFVSSIIADIKAQFGDSIYLILDLCLCTFSKHGHCGLLDEKGQRILNHESVLLLSEFALEYAKAGADMIAPSDMMDGRVRAIRNILDLNNFGHIPIMSYAAKFNSAFYGPFRDTCNSAPGGGCQIFGRETYQIDPGRQDDAISACILDEGGGADVIMVKPGMHYIDIISSIRQAQITKPIAAFHVSGEYMANELLAREGYGKRPALHMECWVSMKRAGANIIISYAARDAKKWISELYG